MADDSREAGAGGTGDGQPPVPSKWWYVGHAFFWVITGLVVYILYKDTNKEAARKHLIVSLVLGIVVAIAFVALMVVVELALFGGDMSGGGYVDDW